jgi:hypothetical protein
MLSGLYIYFYMFADVCVICGPNPIAFCEQIAIYVDTIYRIALVASAINIHCDRD